MAPKRQSFGGWLRKARLDAEISRADLARKGRIEPQYLSSIELGSVSPPSPEVCRRLATALDIMPVDVVTLRAEIAKVDESVRAVVERHLDSMLAELR